MPMGRSAGSKRISASTRSMPRDTPTDEMNSDTTTSAPNRRQICRKGDSETPAIGASTSGTSGVPGYGNFMRINVMAGGPPQQARSARRGLPGAGVLAAKRLACLRSIHVMTQPSTELLDLQAALAGEYSLQRELGRGGMGVVYLARDVQLDRDVAIKVLPAHLASDAAARERFLREARMAARLSHPHIVPIHRVGEVTSPPAAGAAAGAREAGSRFVFFVMSYVEGETLGERLRTRGPLPPAEAMRVLREVAWALAYAHGRGIVHRDVKPDNILLEAATGRALVTDFGIAQGGADAVAVTDPGKVMGTAHFMSPEQAAGEPLDGRSDIYALGVVGYLALSGRLPFESPNLPALLLRQATDA